MTAFAHKNRTTAPTRSDDLFVSGVDTIEMIGGGMARLTYSVNRSGEDGRLHPEPADFALVMPVTAIPDFIGKAIAVTSHAIFVSADGKMTLMQ